MASLMASSYEEQMVPAVFGPWAEDLVDRLDVSSGEKALDIACGTGAVTRVLAGRVGPQGTVVGVDLNPAMLAVAESLGLAQVELRHADATHLPFGDAEFDVITCQQGLQFVPEPDLAVAQMARVLRAGGRVGLACWNTPAENPASAAILAAAEAVGWNEGADGFARAFSLGDEARLTSLLEQADLRPVHVGRERRVAIFPDIPGLMAGFSEGPPFAEDAARTEDSARTRFVAEVLEHLDPYARGATHEVPWVATVAVAVKPE
jgi:SAM-dependent methyltransferase